MQRGRVFKESRVLRWRPAPIMASVTALVQRLHVHAVVKGDDCFMVALNRRIDYSDSTVARRVDVDSVEDIVAACRSVDDGE